LLLAETLTFINFHFSSTADLVGKILTLDQSVESRAEQVVTESSVFFRVKKVARKVAGKIGRWFFFPLFFVCYMISFVTAVGTKY
jgi:hypothetical protein